MLTTVAFSVCARPAKAADTVRIQSAVQTPSAPVAPARALRYDLWLDLSVIAANVALSTAIMVSEPGPSRCRWCERGDLNAVDRWFRDSLRDPDAPFPKTVGRVGVVLLPLSVLSLNAADAFRQGEGWSTFGVDMLIVAEATTTALSLASLSKLLVGRQRPYALGLPEEELAGPRPADENASFFSGHTTLAFSLAVSSGTVASMRGYRRAPVVWATGLTLAALVAYPRMVADEHYFTDLLAGAIAGSTAGFAIPYFFHGPRPIAVSAAPLPGGGAAALVVGSL